ncbi:MAG: LCP family protein [Enterococcus aquimarinus]|uniref:Regulatory protein MsrR n=1 Tax=Enterococcus aquimarinus TaxID=328396 RepID=A0A9E4DS16_9ENTE|nr:LCP family protein [Enterococcus aquimarinus]
MSRMERYKYIHEESNQTKKSPFARRTIHKTEETADDHLTEEVLVVEDPVSVDPMMSDEYEEPSSMKWGDGAEEAAFKNVKKPKKMKRKKRKKNRFLRLLFLLLFLVLGFSVVSFVLGQTAAKAAGTTTSSENFNGFVAENGTKNILLIGNDSREGETSRSDTIMVLQVDGSSKKPKLISFMRDTYVTIPGYGDNKINAAYAFGGADLLRQTLAENFGLETKYYAVVDFQSFAKVIDALFPGGVEIDAEKDMSTYLDVPISQGRQKMDGHTLLQYARFRMDEEGDFGRVRRQQQVMTAIFSQLKNPMNWFRLPYATGKTLGFTATNLPATFLLKNSFTILKGASDVERLTVPVDQSWEYGETYEAGSVLFVDSEMNRQAIMKFLGN